jgi:glycosyltransferase involved in cell wall biosynthesis
MRIGIEAFRIFRAHKHGMDIVALELIRQLQKNDKSNQYYIFCFEDDDIHILDETNNFTIIKIKSLPTPIAEQILLPFLTAYYKLDVLHSTGNTAPLITFCKQIVTLHDIIYLEGKSKLKGGSVYQRIGNYYRKLIVPGVIKRAAKIITVSQSEKEIITENIPKLNSKVEVIPNSYSSHFYKKPEGTSLNNSARYKLPLKPFIFLFGNTDPKKNTLNTLKALGIIHKKGKLNCKIVISDLSKRNIKSMLKSLKMEYLINEIIVTNYISNTDLPDIYNNAQVFLYTSLRESFGIPVLEAMSCGTPVVASNVPAIRETAGSAAHFVNPESAEDIAKGILDVISNDELSSKLIHRGHQQVQKFSWQKSALMLIDTYQGICETSSKESTIVS